MKTISIFQNPYTCVAVVLFFARILMVNLAQADEVQSLPPGGAIVLTPANPSGTGAVIESFEAPSLGSAFFSDGKGELIYQAPTGVDEAVNITIAYNLVGAAKPSSFSVRIDPNYSALTATVAGTAMEWLFVLLVIALFIEAAVLFVVALLRAIIRFIGGKAALGADGPKPSVYKPIFALILSALAVLGFGLGPLNDIVAAFGSEPAYSLGKYVDVTADVLITVLLVAGGAESVRRVATGVMTGLGVPGAREVDEAAEKADTRS